MSKQAILQCMEQWLGPWLVDDNPKDIYNDIVALDYEAGKKLSVEDVEKYLRGRYGLARK